MQFALTYAAGAYDTRQSMMGRQSAGLGFLRAALRASPDRIWCYAPSRALAEVFAKDVKALCEAPPEMRFIPWDQPANLAFAGTLYRPDPGLISGGWNRQTHAGARAYSICAVTHTICTHAAMNAIADIVTAPVYPWDALICTSRVARDVARNLIEARMEDLRSRLDARNFSLPQFPLIPLGIHSEDFVFTTEQRAASRHQLNLGADEVAFLFAGRLTFHGKGHPMPMFLGLEAASTQTGRSVTLILFGQFANMAIEEAFRKEASQFCPSVRLVILDGKDSYARLLAWSAADVFTSLSDNIQETFGLTPVEAMSAGLPVVVSDWDGYKDTVRDGVDGFRVPVTMAAPNTGGDLADRYDAGVDDFDIFIGQVSLYTAVDVSAVTDAYSRLIVDPELRLSMGRAGQKRVSENYDWNIIFRRYSALWDELAERRRADPSVNGEQRRTRRPDRPDPFTIFQTFASRSLMPTTRVSLRRGATVEDAVSRLRLGSVGYARVLPSPDLIEKIMLILIRSTSVVYRDLVAGVGEYQPTSFERAVLWLAKLGLIDLKY